ncbi:type I-F CRISPR-associated protein Csy2 [Vulcaniibacterium tengchongense]|uniref:CRISPR-associated Csy2 family protein n=1 Tax=Vulcaniibacterium tengchongense TaxID=1273429 RepID=A0A3N4VB25_9GAMM|nr:type I-F CRISPR-associated protein Csy2 [Vulcaniibacterium tengchongense]RPE79788.1 CRISPR-associated Csy2 family protein [Vulcaniibacterium tengchongense]
MSQCPDYTHLLVLPHLRVQNANAISSPLTHGFPAVTAFLGLTWALERKANAAGLGHLAFNAVGVVCHGWQEQVTDGYVKAFRLTRNPVEKDGSTAAIVEEGRIHLDLSLVFALNADEWDDARRDADVQAVANLVAGMRIAGGSVVPTTEVRQGRSRPWLADMTGDGWQKNFRALCVRLLPGSALVARDDLIDQELAQLQEDDPRATRLDAWLSLSRVNWHYDPEAEDGEGRWIPSRGKGDGWIVPIPVGYGALSGVYPPGTVRNARDAKTPFRFVESLYSMGEWVGTHRLRSPADFLWYADSQAEAGVYRCRNDYRPVEPASTAL